MLITNNVFFLFHLTMTHSTKTSIDGARGEFNNADSIQSNAFSNFLYYVQKITIICLQNDFIKLNQAKFSTVLLRIVAEIVRGIKID